MKIKKGNNEEKKPEKLKQIIKGVRDVKKKEKTILSEQMIERQGG